MRSMFSSNSEGLLSVTGLEVHLDCQFRFTGIDVGCFSFSVFSSVSFDEALCLIDEDSLSCLRFALTSNSKGGVEITNIFIHADGLVSFSCLDEFDFSLFVSLLVLKFKGKFQVNVSNFVFGVLVGHFECLIEIPFVRKILDDCINEVHLQHHLHSLFRTQ